MYPLLFFEAMFGGSRIQGLHQELRCTAVPEKCAGCVTPRLHMDHASGSPHASSHLERRKPKVCLVLKEEEMCLGLIITLRNFNIKPL